MKAVETTYGRTLFRSRLEARYAAFFDALSWQWTYEAAIGHRYLPDFVIGGNAPMVIEVKPAVTAQDYSDAITKVALGLENHWTHDILIVGLNPVAASLDGCCRLHPAAGLLGRGRTFATGCWFRCPVCTGIAVAQRGSRFLARPCGHRAVGAEVGGPAGSAVAAAWADATNRVRWTPRVGHCRG